jgi:hypothetical protein
MVRLGLEPKRDLISGQQAFGRERKVISDHPFAGLGDPHGDFFT